MKSKYLLAIIIFSVVALFTLSFSFNEVHASERISGVEPSVYNITWYKWAPATMKIGQYTTFKFKISSPTPNAVLKYERCRIVASYLPLGAQSHIPLAGSGQVVDGVHNYHVILDYGAAGTSGLANYLVSLPATYTLSITNSDEVKTIVNQKGKLDVTYSVQCGNSNFIKRHVTFVK